MAFKVEPMNIARAVGNFFRFAAFCLVHILMKLVA